MVKSKTPTVEDDLREIEEQIAMEEEENSSIPEGTTDEELAADEAIEQEVDLVKVNESYQPRDNEHKVSVMVAPQLYDTTFGPDSSISLSSFQKNEPSGIGSMIKEMYVSPGLATFVLENDEQWIYTGPVAAKKMGQAPKENDND